MVSFAKHGNMTTHAVMYVPLVQTLHIVWRESAQQSLLAVVSVLIVQKVIQYGISL
jgi:hypothetical protein